MFMATKIADVALVTATKSSSVVAYSYRESPVVVFKPIAAGERVQGFYPTRTRAWAMRQLFDTQQ